MFSNYFLLLSASLLLTRMDWPSILPLSHIPQAISLWKKSKDTSKIQAPRARGHLHLTRFYIGLSRQFEASRHLLQSKSFFAMRTSCNPYAHCTTGPVGGQSRGSGSKLMMAGGWRNIGWVRPAENPAQRFQGRYSLRGWPGRRLCSSSSSPDTQCRSQQAGLEGELQPRKFVSEIHQRAHAALVFCVTAIDWLPMRLRELIHLQKVRWRT